MGKQKGNGTPSSAPGPAPQPRQQQLPIGPLGPFMHNANAQQTAAKPAPPPFPPNVMSGSDKRARVIAALQVCECVAVTEASRRATRPFYGHGKIGSSFYVTPAKRLIEVTGWSWRVGNPLEMTDNRPGLKSLEALITAIELCGQTKTRDPFINALADG